MGEMLSPLGSCHFAVDGEETVEAVRTALAEDAPYDLLCLDINMPNKDGHQALEEIRKLEDEHGVALGQGTVIIITTAESGSKAILQAFDRQCEAYVVKPIIKERLLDQISKLGLIPGRLS